jgi:molybdopterin/thiamine biosynthesis adenylyltransferase
MKMMIVGCGGIGSFLIEEVAKKIEQEQFSELTCEGVVSIADSDIVELNQIKYQNFRHDEVGKNKAEALEKRYANVIGFFHAIPNRITKESQLKGYDFFVLCVDNEQTRKLVVEYCHKNNKQFIDLRAEGRKIFVMPKETLQENMKFIDTADHNEYSCQERSDLDKGYIQMGNKIVALIGVQYILNFERGHTNRALSLII